MSRAAGDILQAKARRANTNRRKGDAFEAAVCRDQERIGRISFRVRQGGGEPVDIVSIDAGWDWAGLPSRVHFIQCKSGKRGPYIPPAELEAFKLKAEMAGAVAMVAFKSGKSIEYKVL